MRVPAGGRIGPYEVLGLLGAGGMGEVYRARDTRLNRTVAIKVITDNGTDPHAVRRFESEALSASALNHPNILTVHEFGLHDGLPYLVTEFVEGETLRERLQRGALPVANALDIAIQVATGLEGAHAIGLVHRDIKPENVMLRPDGYVKILDFGLAKLAPTAKAAIQTDTISMRTTPGMLVGTIGYMAPEQVRGLAADERSDVWSLGIMLHEMLTGVAPFGGPTTSDVIASILEREPPPLEQRGVEVPAELSRIVSRALAKDRRQRYQTIRDVLIDLQRLKQESLATAGGRTATSSGLGSSSSWPKWTMLVLAVIVALSAGAFIWHQISVNTTPATTTASAPVGHALHYWLTVQRFRDGKEYQTPFDSAGQEIFENGWKFRLNLESGEGGFLYLLNEGPAAEGKPTLRWLYPAPAKTAAVGARQVVQTGWNEFDSHPGMEQFWIVWSPREVPELEHARVITTDLGDVKDTQEALAVQAFLRARASAAAVVKDSATRHSIVTSSGNVVAVRAELQHQ